MTMSSADNAQIELPSDDELTALALAADADMAVDDDALSLWELTSDDGADLLPSWYMPSPRAGARLLRGWRRRVAILVIVAFLLIEAYGLCSTYGQVVLG